MHHVPSTAVENLSVVEHLVDLGSCGGVEFAEHQRRMTQHFGELRPGIRPDHAYLVQGQRWHVQRQTSGFRRREPRDRRQPTANQGSESGGVENLPADHAAGATGCRRRTSSSPGQATPDCW